MKLFLAIGFFCFLSGCTLRHQINQAFKKDFISDTGYQKIRILLRYSKEQLEGDTGVSKIMDFLHKNDFLYLHHIGNTTGIICYTDSITPKGHVYLTDTIYRKYKYDTIFYGTFKFFKIKKITLGKIIKEPFYGDDTTITSYDPIFNISYQLTPMFDNLKNRTKSSTIFLKKGKVVKAENKRRLNDRIYGAIRLETIGYQKNYFMQGISSDYFRDKYEEMLKQNSINK